MKHRIHPPHGSSCLFMLLLFAASASAELNLPAVLGDGAILQRDEPVMIWGWADSRYQVQVFVDGVRAGVGRARDGRFRIPIGAYPAGGPHRIVVAAQTPVTIEDVWFGDVWVAGGQSNMELTLERVTTRYPEAAREANYPLIREFKVPRKYAFDAPAEDLDGGEWKPTTPESVLSSSAVAYYFARDLHERYEVPIGIISSNFGGSAAESWMSEQALRDYPHYLRVATSYRDTDYLQGLLDADKARTDAWHAALDARDAGLRSEPAWFAPEFDDGRWATTEVPGLWKSADLGDVDGAVWYRKTLELPSSAEGLPGSLHLGRIDDADTAWVNGTEVGSTTYMWPPRIYPIPAGILKGGENHIAVRVVDSGMSGGFIEEKEYRLSAGGEDYPLEGRWRYRVGTAAAARPEPEFVAWRQPLGFYNAMLAPLANLRIKGVIWYQGETNVGRAKEYAELFPAMIRDWRRLWRQGDFPFIFVQLANYLEARAEPGDSDWADLRDAQRRALRVPNTAMAVAIDVGEWNDIHPLDKKTVGERLALAARSLAYGETGVVTSGPMFRSLMKRGDQLVIEFDHVGRGLEVKGDVLRGFALQAESGEWVWADAEIRGETVVVESDAIADPVRVRYAWADNPDRANLYNEEGLPASPFQASTSGRTE